MQSREAIHQPHVGDRIQCRAAGEHEPPASGRADQVTDDVEQRVFEHELRCGRLVETFLVVDRGRGDIDAHHRIGVPHGIERNRRTEDVMQRLGVGFRLQAARPVRQRAVQPHRAVVFEAEHVAQPAVIAIGQPVAVAPRGAAHVATLAAEDRPAALGRADHAVEAAERIEDVAIAVHQRDVRAARQVKRDGAIVADAVEHADHHRFVAAGERRHRVGEIRMVVVMAHADDRHRAAQAQLPPKPPGRAERTRDMACVHRREVLRPEEDAAGREFLGDAAQQRRGQRDVVPACDEGVDLTRIDAGAVEHRQHGVQALFGPGGAVADAAVALLLVVADQADPVGARGLDQCRAAVVAGGSDTDQIDALAALQFRGEVSAAFTRIGAVRGVEAVARGIAAQQRIRDACRQCAEKRMGRTVAAVDHGHCATISSAR